MCDCENILLIMEIRTLYKPYLILCSSMFTVMQNMLLETSMMETDSHILVWNRVNGNKSRDKTRLKSFSQSV
jgi:hypothetical protein